jgi:FkbH-like protein
MKEAAARQDAAAALSAARTLLTGVAKPSDFVFCASSLAGMGASLIAQLGTRRLTSYVVRSATVEPIVPFLISNAALVGYLLDLRLGGYGSYIDELLNPESELASSKPELVLILLDLEELAGRLPELCASGTNPSVGVEIMSSLDRFGQLLRTFRSHSSARLLVQGLVVPDFTPLGDVADSNLPFALPAAIHELNRGLAAICASINDCIFFDVDRVAARYGRARWRDTRMYLGSRLPVSAEFFKQYAENLIRYVSPLFRAPRKVLCTDLDNTLWGGILGEDGPEGIATGTAFPGNCYLEYQKYLKQLSARGILLAAVSKNNDSDVREAFRIRSADLALQLEDFVALKISWNEKAESIRELARELSLGLDSFVFIDDNAMECEAIRRQLPEVEVLAAPVDEPWKLIEMLARKFFFDVAAVTNDDVNRVQDYKAQAQRAELERTFGDRDDFLASMDIVCTFQSALDAPLARAVQLLGKTNQFNLTTRRRSAAEVEEFANVVGGQAIAIRVIDRFGDAGVVGLALARTQGSTCVIDSFLLSCRVIGRGIETAILAYVAEQAVRDGATTLKGEFVPTKKNAPCATFYADHGFTSVHTDPDSGAILYELDLTARVPTNPAWITVKGNQEHELSAGSVLSS